MKLNLIMFKPVKKERVCRYEDFPNALKTRILKELGIMVLVLVVGIILSVSMPGVPLKEQLLMVAATIVVAGIMGYIAYDTYTAVSTGAFEVFEGTCITNTLTGNNVVKLWSAVKKNRNIQFESSDGTAYTIICKESGKIARSGFPIKVYVPTNAKPLLKDGEYVIYQYLAIESSGKKK